MASIQDINIAIEKMNQKWENPTARNGLFGNIIKSLTIQNIRGIDTKIEFSWPVTIIGGANGSGKTTAIQLCSTAFAKEEGGRYYTIGGWVRSAMIGETPPYGDRSSVGFSFWDDTFNFDVVYNSSRTRWGYPRSKNPKRFVEFIGITAFAPRIERRDRLNVFRTKLEIKQSDDMEPRVLESFSRILNINYENACLHTVGVAKKKWEDTLPQLTKRSVIYTEPHMGAGEQKIVRLVSMLEKYPARSLILLEEPELTLHPDAQRGLAWYLITLSLRKGHQIIVATHSPTIFESMPDKAKVLLVRNRDGVQVLHEAKHLDVARELCGISNTNKDIIIVEDDVAKTFLTEILRRFDSYLLNQACIVPVGNTDDVRNMTITLKAEGIRVVGIRDADTGSDESIGLFSLPGNAAPETLLLEESNIRNCSSLMSGIVETYGRAKVRGIGYDNPSERDKRVMKALIDEMGYDASLIADRLTLAWLNNNSDIAEELTKKIKEGLDR